ncbi:hypothetical protein NKG05_04580 [Oerskovia sp. M15]
MTAPGTVVHHPAARTGAPGADRASVVLLHGGNVASWMWEPQVERLDDLDLWTPTSGVRVEGRRGLGVARRGRRRRRRDGRRPRRGA